VKRQLIYGIAVIASGLLIALGPQFLFKLCAVDCCDEIPICHWSGQAELGIGFLIAGLGACMIIFTDRKTQLGLLIGTFLASIIALAIPHMLIGGCEMMEMSCHRVAFPALTVESVILMLFTTMAVLIDEARNPLRHRVFAKKK